MPSPSYNYTCNETTIKNVSGSVIPSLSLFGKSNVLPGGTFTVPGNVYAYLAARHLGIKGRRMIDKFNELMETGYLAIAGSPSSTCGNDWNSSSSRFVSP
jgi:hypothetical protein